MNDITNQCLKGILLCLAIALSSWLLAFVSKKILQQTMGIW